MYFIASNSIYNNKIAEDELIDAHINGGIMSSGQLEILEEKIQNIKDILTEMFLRLSTKDQIRVANALYYTEG